MSDKKTKTDSNPDELKICPLSMVTVPRFCCYEKCMAWNNGQCALMRFLSFFPYMYFREKRESAEMDQAINGKEGSSIPYG